LVAGVCPWAGAGGVFEDSPAALIVFMRFFNERSQPSATHKKIALRRTQPLLMLASLVGSRWDDKMYSTEILNYG